MLKKIIEGYYKRKKARGLSFWHVTCLVIQTYIPNERYQIISEGIGLIKHIRTYELQSTQMQVISPESIWSGDKNLVNVSCSVSGALMAPRDYVTHFKLSKSGRQTNKS